MAQARVPKDRQAAQSKPEIAIEEIDRIYPQIDLVFSAPSNGK